MRGNIFAFGALITIAAAWGMTIPLAAIAVKDGLQQFALIFWELVIVSIFLGGILAFRGRLLRPRVHHLPILLVVGFMGTIFPNALSYTAYPHLPAGVMAIVTSLVPMASLPVALLWGNEHFNPIRMLGLVFGALAILMLVGPSTSLPDPTKAVYVLIAALAVLFYAIEGNFVAKYGLFGMGPMQALFASSVLAMVFVCPMMFATGQEFNMFRPWGRGEWALFILSILHAMAYTGYVWLVGHAGAVFSAQVAYLVTAFGVLFSILLLSETYSAWVWGALAVMMIGLVLVQPKKADAESS